MFNDAVASDEVQGLFICSSSHSVFSEIEDKYYFSSVRNME
jgi:hypothetical protein